MWAWTWLSVTILTATTPIRNWTRSMAAPTALSCLRAGFLAGIKNGNTWSDVARKTARSWAATCYLNMQVMKMKHERMSPTSSCNSCSLSFHHPCPPHPWRGSAWTHQHSREVQLCSKHSFLKLNKIWNIKSRVIWWNHIDTEESRSAENCDSLHSRPTWAPRWPWWWEWCRLYRIELRPCQPCWSWTTSLVPEDNNIDTTD